MEWDLIGRLSIAGLLSIFVGIDREYRAKDAGVKTHFLVALGSALFMIISRKKLAKEFQKRLKEFLLNLHARICYNVGINSKIGVLL